MKTRLLAVLLVLPIVPVHWFWLHDRQREAEQGAARVTELQQLLVELEKVVGEVSALPDDRRALAAAHEALASPPATLAVSGNADDPRACETWLAGLPGWRLVAFAPRGLQFQATLARKR